MSYANLTIVGNVGKDPELKYTPSGTAVTDFSIAVNRSYTKDDGTKVDEVTWFRVTCWRRQAEVVAQYVSKGKQVMVVASKVEANAYTDKQGNNRATLEVTADRVVFLQGGGDSGQARNTNDASNDDIPF